MPKLPPPSAIEVTPELFTLGREAILDMTTEETIGEPAGSIIEDGSVVTLYFETAVAAYTGWRWTVSLGDVEAADGPTVLEASLTPGDGALLSPDWVPWADRLADYKDAQAEIAAESAGVDDDSDADADDDDDDTDDDDDDDTDDDDDDDDDTDDDDDDDDFDDEDVNDDDEALLHSGDLDGVDIDALDIDALDIDAPDIDASVGSASSAMTGGEESEDSEAESGDAGPEPVAKTRSNQRAKKQQHDDKADQPEG